MKLWRKEARYFSVWARAWDFTGKPIPFHTRHEQQAEVMRKDFRIRRIGLTDAHNLFYAIQPRAHEFDLKRRPR